MHTVHKHEYVYMYIHTYMKNGITVVWEIFDLEIFSYSNNCSKFKRVKFSHGKFKRAKFCTVEISCMHACTYIRNYNNVRDTWKELRTSIIIVVAMSILNYFQAQGRSA